MQGIYKIHNRVNGKFYIGSSKNTRTRFTYHRNRLDKGIHDNDYLQAAWKKYGSANFTFEVIEPVDDSNLLLEREQWHLDTSLCFQRSIGYNITPTANRTILAPESIEKIRRSQLGRKASVETKALLSRLRKGVPRPGNSKPMASNPKAKAVHQYTAEGIFVKTWSCMKEAYNTLNICSTSICGVCAGKHKLAGGFQWKYATYMPANRPSKLAA